jgi:myo-inositol-1(or 4)-monophosphatase
MNGADDLALLTGAAHAAGEIALRYWKKAPQTWDKGAGAGPVTEADLAVNAMLAAELRAARPDYGWLSEETPDTNARLHNDNVFIIDPIDGTRAFIDGAPDFAHSLAVAERGRITAAVVYLPAKNSLYSASVSTISTLNGVAIACSARQSTQDATLLAAKPNMAPEHWQGGAPPTVRRLFRSSLAWRMCLVAEGAFDAMLTLRPTWEWDVAAGSLIACQAGARVVDRRGRPITYNSESALANGVIAGPDGLCRDLQRQLRD